MEETPQIVALDYVLVAADFPVKLCIPAFQIRCAELAANGFVFRKLLLQTVNFSLEFCNQLAIEDIHGIRAEKQREEVHLVFDGSKRNMDASVYEMLSAWAEQSEKFRNGEISKEQYDHWRYTFPAEDTTQIWGKVPSQEFSDAFVKSLKKYIND